MQVTIRTRKIEVNTALRTHVDRRFRFALGRFGERIVSVSVGFEDANGERGGVDKHCRVAVALRPTGRVFIEDVDTDLRTVVDRVADRAARAVDRDLHRREGARKVRPHTPMTRHRRGHIDATVSDVPEHRSEEVEDHDNPSTQ